MGNAHIPGSVNSFDLPASVESADSGICDVTIDSCESLPLRSSSITATSSPNPSPSPTCRPWRPFSICRSRNSPNSIGDSASSMTPASLDPAAYWNTVAQTASRTLTPDQIAALIEIDSRSWSHPAPVDGAMGARRPRRRPPNRHPLQHARPRPRLCPALPLAARVRCANVFLRGRRMQARA